MDEKVNPASDWRDKKRVKIVNRYGGGGSALYGIGIIGALVYFLPKASTFMEFLIAVIKSLGWPALVVYQVLRLLKL